MGSLVALLPGPSFPVTSNLQRNPATGWLHGFGGLGLDDGGAGFGPHRALILPELLFVVCSEGSLKTHTEQIRAIHSSFWGHRVPSCPEKNSFPACDSADEHPPGRVEHPSGGLQAAERLQACPDHCRRPAATGRREKTSLPRFRWD